MARVIPDGEVRIWFATTVANKAAPTVAEVNAGTDITPRLNSLDTPLEGEAVPANDLSSAYNKTVTGRFGGSITAEFFRDQASASASDTFFNLFPRNTSGFIIVRYFGGSTVAIAIGHLVSVFPVRTISRSPATLDSGAIQEFAVNMAGTDEPSEQVAVV